MSRTDVLNPSLIDQGLDRIHRAGKPEPVSGDPRFKAVFDLSQLIVGKRVSVVFDNADLLAQLAASFDEQIVAECGFGAYEDERKLLTLLSNKHAQVLMHVPGDAAAIQKAADMKAAFSYLARVLLREYAHGLQLLGAGKLREAAAKKQELIALYKQFVKLSPIHPLKKDDNVTNQGYTLRGYTDSGKAIPVDIEVVPGADGPADVVAAKKFYGDLRAMKGPTFSEQHRPVLAGKLTNAERRKREPHTYWSKLMEGVDGALSYAQARRFARRYAVDLDAVLRNAAKGSEFLPQVLADAVSPKMRVGSKKYTLAQAWIELQKLDQKGAKNATQVQQELSQVLRAMFGADAPIARRPRVIRRPVMPPKAAEAAKAAPMWLDPAKRETVAAVTAGALKQAARVYVAAAQDTDDYKTCHHEVYVVFDKAQRDAVTKRVQYLRMPSQPVTTGDEKAMAIGGGDGRHAYSAAEVDFYNAWRVQAHNAAGIKHYALPDPGAGPKPHHKHVWVPMNKLLGAGAPPVADFAAVAAAVNGAGRMQAPERVSFVAQVKGRFVFVDLAVTVDDAGKKKVAATIHDPARTVDATSGDADNDVRDLLDAGLPAGCTIETVNITSKEQAKKYADAVADGSLQKGYDGVIAMHAMQCAASGKKFELPETAEAVAKLRAQQLPQMRALARYDSAAILSALRADASMHPNPLAYLEQLHTYAMADFPSVKEKFDYPDWLTVADEAKPTADEEAQRANYERQVLNHFVANLYFQLAQGKRVHLPASGTGGFYGIPAGKPWSGNHQQFIKDALAQFSKFSKRMSDARTAARPQDKVKLQRDAVIKLQKDHPDFFLAFYQGEVSDADALNPLPEKSLDFQMKVKAAKDGHGPDVIEQVYTRPRGKSHPERCKRAPGARLGQHLVVIDDSKLAAYEAAKTAEVIAQAKLIDTLKKAYNTLLPEGDFHQMLTMLKDAMGEDGFYELMHLPIEQGKGVVGADRAAIEACFAHCTNPWFAAHKKKIIDALSVPLSDDLNVGQYYFNALKAIGEGLQLEDLGADKNYEFKAEDGTVLGEHSSLAELMYATQGGGVDAFKRLSSTEQAKAMFAQIPKAILESALRDDAGADIEFMALHSETGDTTKPIDRIFDDCAASIREYLNEPSPAKKQRFYLVHTTQAGSGAGHYRWIAVDYASKTVFGLDTMVDKGNFSVNPSAIQDHRHDKSARFNYRLQRLQADLAKPSSAHADDAVTDARVVALSADEVGMAAFTPQDGNENCAEYVMRGLKWTKAHAATHGAALAKIRQKYSVEPVMPALPDGGTSVDLAKESHQVASASLPLDAIDAASIVPADAVDAEVAQLATELKDKTHGELPPGTMVEASALPADQPGKHRAWLDEQIVVQAHGIKQFNGFISGIGATIIDGTIPDAFTPPAFIPAAFGSWNACKEVLKISLVRVMSDLGLKLDAVEDASTLPLAIREEIVKVAIDATKLMLQRQSQVQAHHAGTAAKHAQVIVDKKLPLPVRQALHIQFDALKKSYHKANRALTNVGESSREVEAALTAYKRQFAAYQEHYTKAIHYRNADLLREPVGAVLGLVNALRYEREDRTFVANALLAVANTHGIDLQKLATDYHGGQAANQARVDALKQLVHARLYRSPISDSAPVAVMTGEAADRKLLVMSAYEWQAKRAQWSAKLDAAGAAKPPVLVPIESADDQLDKLTARLDSAVFKGNLLATRDAVRTREKTADPERRREIAAANLTFLNTVHNLPTTFTPQFIRGMAGSAAAYGISLDKILCAHLDRDGAHNDRFQNDLLNKFFDLLKEAHGWRLRKQPLPAAAPLAAAEIKQVRETMADELKLATIRGASTATNVLAAVRNSVMCKDVNDATQTNAVALQNAGVDSTKEIWEQVFALVRIDDKFQKAASAEFIKRYASMAGISLSKLHYSAGDGGLAKMRKSSALLQLIRSGKAKLEQRNATCIADHGVRLSPLLKRGSAIDGYDNPINLVTLAGLADRYGVDLQLALQSDEGMARLQQFIQCASIAAFRLQQRIPVGDVTSVDALIAAEPKLAQTAEAFVALQTAEYMYGCNVTDDSLAAVARCKGQFATTVGEAKSGLDLAQLQQGRLVEWLLEKPFDDLPAGDILNGRQTIERCIRKYVESTFAGRPGREISAIKNQMRFALVAFLHANNRQMPSAEFWRQVDAQFDAGAGLQYEKAKELFKAAGEYGQLTLGASALMQQQSMVLAARVLELEKVEVAPGNAFKYPTADLQAKLQGYDGKKAGGVAPERNQKLWGAALIGDVYLAADASNAKFIDDASVADKWWGFMKKPVVTLDLPLADPVDKAVCMKRLKSLADGAGVNLNAYAKAVDALPVADDLKKRKLVGRLLRLVVQIEKGWMAPLLDSPPHKAKLDAYLKAIKAFSEAAPSQVNAAIAAVDAAFDKLVASIQLTADKDGVPQGTIDPRFMAALSRTMAKHILEKGAADDAIKAKFGPDKLQQVRMQLVSYLADHGIVRFDWQHADWKTVVTMAVEYDTLKQEMASRGIAFDADKWQAFEDDYLKPEPKRVAKADLDQPAKKLRQSLNQGESRVNTLNAAMANAEVAGVPVADRGAAELAGIKDVIMAAKAADADPTKKIIAAKAACAQLENDYNGAVADGDPNEIAKAQIKLAAARLALSTVECAKDGATAVATLIKNELLRAGDPAGGWVSLKDLLKGFEAHHINAVNTAFLASDDANIAKKLAGVNNHDKTLLCHMLANNNLKLKDVLKRKSKDEMLELVQLAKACHAHKAYQDAGAVKDSDKMALHLFEMKQVLPIPVTQLKQIFADAGGLPLTGAALDQKLRDLITGNQATIAAIDASRVPQRAERRVHLFRALVLKQVLQHAGINLDARVQPPNPDTFNTLFAALIVSVSANAANLDACRECSRKLCRALAVHVKAAPIVRALMTPDDSVKSVAERLEAYAADKAVRASVEASYKGEPNPGSVAGRMASLKRFKKKYRKAAANDSVFDPNAAKEADKKKLTEDEETLTALKMMRHDQELAAKYAKEREEERERNREDQKFSFIKGGKRELDQTLMETLSRVCNLYVDEGVTRANCTSDRDQITLSSNPKSSSRDHMRITREVDPKTGSVSFTVRSTSYDPAQKARALAVLLMREFYDKKSDGTYVAVPIIIDDFDAQKLFGEKDAKKAQGYLRDAFIEVQKTEPQFKQDKDFKLDEMLSFGDPKPKPPRPRPNPGKPGTPPPPSDPDVAKAHQWVDANAATLQGGGVDLAKLKQLAATPQGKQMFQAMMKRPLDDSSIGLLKSMTSIPTRPRASSSSAGSGKRLGS